MPWSETSPMSERLRFISDYLAALEDFTTLCRRYSVSRPTGYKWVARYEADGPAGLHEHSRRPHTSPTATAPAVCEALLTLRRRHPAWGPKKLVVILARRAATLGFAPEQLPAPSTAAALLKRAGLVPGARRRPHPVAPRASARAVADGPNALWTVDFKGQFKTRDGVYCYPLTVADCATRYVLACRALTSTSYAESQPVFRQLFQTYGLPARIRSDNGGPFASLAVGRLSRLSVWWIRLGIRPELITPAHPEENGSHERMHRDLKRDTTRPPAPTRRAQQYRFDAWCTEFNTERPHEALGQTPPAAHYTASPRVYPTRLPLLEYPAHHVIRRVTSNGCLRWNGRWLSVSHVLCGQSVGFEEIDDGLWTLHFGPIVLGRFDERCWRITSNTAKINRCTPHPNV